MSTLTFVKIQGAGNDFILIDDRALFFDPAQVPKLCHRQFGIGADGVILLQNDAAADFRMRIFNKDGSEAESCGNGLRCLFRFILDLGFPERTYRIATANRIVEASPHREKIAIRLSAEIDDVKQLYIGDHSLYFLDTGVPHVVLFVPEADKVNVEKEGAFLRSHPFFQPRGTNVNFAEVRKDHIRIRTFERGLEGESLACGTGAAAVAAVVSQNFGWADPIRISCRGGELEFFVKQGLQMVGPATKVFEGTYLWSSSVKREKTLSCLVTAALKSGS